MLRTRGHAFVIITIALLLAAQILAVNLRGLTKGSDGITLELPFWSKDFQNIPFYYVFLLILVLTVLFSAWIRRTKFGTGLVAIREDEGKAAAIGVNTTRFKVLAYAASSFFIGVAGGVYAYFLTFLNPVGVVRDPRQRDDRAVRARRRPGHPVRPGGRGVHRAAHQRGGDGLRRRQRQPGAA